MDLCCLLTDLSSIAILHSSQLQFYRRPHLSDVWRIQERCKCEGFILLFSIYHLLENILSLSFTNTRRVNVVLIKMTNIMLKGKDDAGGDGGSVLARLMLLVRRFQFKAFSISNSQE